MIYKKVNKEKGGNHYQTDFRMWNPNYFQVSTYLKKIQNEAIIDLVECYNHIIQSNTSIQILAKKGQVEKEL